jgi:membrane dipeptidase
MTAPPCYVPAVSGAPEISSEARALHDDCVVMDLHCDVLLNETLLGYDPTRRHRNRVPLSPWLFHADIPRLKAGGVTAVAMGLVINPVRRGSAVAATFRGLDQVAGWLERAPDDVALASVADDIVAAKAEGRVALFGGLEGAHGLHGRLEVLPEMRERGLRYVGMAHFSRNLACTPAYGWRANHRDGLTEHGRELVDELNRLRILVDLAHINRPGFLEAAARSKVPVIVSHTGVSGAFDTWRNIDDEQLRAVAETGGVVCIIFAPVYLAGTVRAGSEAIVAHIRHVIDVVGEEHVGLGSDLDGFIVPPRDMPDISFLPLLTQRMLEAGMGERTIRRCLGDNMVRVFREVCG